MKRFWTFAVVAALGLGCSRPSAQDKDAHGSAEKEAQAAGEGWLALVDSGGYAQSWTESAAYFRRTVDQAAWEKAASSVRAPLGKVQSRKLASATYTTTTPGAPDGEYVVLLFDTSFENKQAARETVKPMKDPDGRWRVSGYYIK